MKSFTHIIRNPSGLHARPAGALAALAKQFESTVSLQAGNDQVEVRRLMAVMRLCLRQGDCITVWVEGADEEVACSAIQDFFSANL